MDRTWQVFPTSERIVSDINKFPKAVDAIIEAVRGMGGGGPVDEQSALGFGAIATYALFLVL